MLSVHSFANKPSSAFHRELEIYYLHKMKTCQDDKFCFYIVSKESLTTFVCRKKFIWFLIFSVNNFAFGWSSTRNICFTHQIKFYNCCICSYFFCYQTCKRSRKVRNNNEVLEQNSCLIFASPPLTTWTKGQWTSCLLNNCG